MAKSSFTRREFLKVSALSSTAVALGGCASLDRLFMGDKRDLANEVIILGAGAAGLAAAYSLKKKKIPFRIFEASSRVGGRVQSISVFPEGGPVAELGAEFFEESHQSIFTLAKDLNLDVRQVKSTPGLEAHMFSFNGQIYQVKDLVPRMKTLQAPLRRVRADLYRQQDVTLTYKNSLQYERSTYYDSLSLKDLLNLWKSEVDPLILELIEAQAIARFGVDAESQSSIHFLETLDAEGSSLLSGRNTFRMEGGLNRLISTLQGRVAGVVPDYILKTNHVLTDLSEKKDVFTLTFQTPKGKETYTTKNVICTIPFSKLREVNGLQEIGFSNLKKEAILTQAYATHSKGVLAFNETFWRKKSGKTPGNVGNFTGDFVTQKFWDSGRAQEGTQGLLTFQRGGKSGAETGGNAAAVAKADLSLFYADLGSKQVLNSEVINWSLKPWALGSMAYFKKGQYMRYKGVAGEPEFGGRFLFAGEHTSLKFAGTLHGAIESGLQAAAAISI
ncbi:FAD-dependent oxidoreductase [Bdellovibrio svalbardensis]|uniref:Tryptophan 2-monooxygenase n=1 Tax=Bdellovibrio svalbardensis TaxID=2972972 RepID=A0ABT6DHR9_9BACT|nr:FAD-dependent oxidoreductase [Bdellovibrio svalbardensis]MDG0816054.1 FAD-dependent oxidoreductase [Bdellovibrio svalbardensis]